MSSARVLFDQPGPRARRRTLVITIVSLVALAALVYWVIAAFAAHSTSDVPIQLSDGSSTNNKWAPLFQGPILRKLGDALLSTLEVAGMSAVFAFPAGILLAVGRLSAHSWLRWIVTVWVEVFRSTPLLLLIYMFVGALPSLGLNFSLFWKVTIPVILVGSAVIAEVVRAGILALPKGQKEAGMAIGLRPGQVMRLIILPQALRLLIPALVTQLISLVKDSTLGYAASYLELLFYAQSLTAFYNNFIQSYLLVALIYFLVCWLLSLLARWLEIRLQRGKKTRGLATHENITAAEGLGAGTGGPAMNLS